MSEQRIIMNYSAAPSLDDIESIAGDALEALPDELTGLCSGLLVNIEEFPDEVLELEMELEDSYELLAFYKNGKEISPGVERKTANDDDVLMIYRRPLLDMWCESGDDLAALVRQIILEELGRHFELSEDDIDEIRQQHYQGML